MTAVIIFGVFILAMLVLGGFVVRFAIRLGREERRKIVAQQTAAEEAARGR